jgi:hypothetical protein
MPTPKRINKTKEEIAMEMAKKQVVAQEKILAKKMFELISNVDTIYDAQTVVNALSGYIKYEVQVRNSALTVNDLLIDLSKEKPSKINDAMSALKTEFQNEKALDLANLLERFGKTLAQYGANEFLKNPMDTIKVDDIVA